LWIKGEAVIAQPLLDTGDMALGIPFEFIDGISGFCCGERIPLARMLCHA
jgi:hypothetical protein